MRKFLYVLFVFFVGLLIAYVVDLSNPFHILLGGLSFVLILGLFILLLMASRDKFVVKVDYFVPLETSLKEASLDHVNAEIDEILYPVPDKEKGERDIVVEVVDIDFGSKVHISSREAERQIRDKGLEPIDLRTFLVLVKVYPFLKKKRIPILASVANIHAGTYIPYSEYAFSRTSLVLTPNYGLWEDDVVFLGMKEIV